MEIIYRRHFHVNQKVDITFETLLKISISRIQQCICIIKVCTHSTSLITLSTVRRRFFSNSCYKSLFCSFHIYILSTMLSRCAFFTLGLICWTQPPDHMDSGLDFQYLRWSRYSGIGHGVVLWILSIAQAFQLTLGMYNVFL